MNLTTQIAKNLRDVYFGGNWTWVNLKQNLEGLTWQQATKQVHSFNTIATLVFHSCYYVTALIQVLQRNPLDANDKYSFAHPPIHSQEDWDNFLSKVWEEAELLAKLIEQMPEQQLWEDFSENKYGNYYRNVHGVIEHLHYHLGQISLIKKLLLEEK